uniref:Ovule protein n=1 Tax=Steinernema glaseri TaxID=37863 RepID=A0A1I7YVP3_9BILA
MFAADGRGRGPPKFTSQKTSVDVIRPLGEQRKNTFPQITFSVHKRGNAHHATNGPVQSKNGPNSEKP